MNSMTVLSGSYDYRLVALSVVLAVLASYAALDLAGRVTSAQGRARGVWLGAGAAAMGLGIWAMHYVGMLALTMPIPVAYHLPIVMLSLLAAIAASGVALFVVSRTKMSVGQGIAGSVVMGTGIASMHYIGMAAMRCSTVIVYDRRIVAASVGLAIAISFVALHLGFRVRDEHRVSRRKIISALVMGSAIPLMHYTGKRHPAHGGSGCFACASRALKIENEGTDHPAPGQVDGNDHDLRGRGGVPRTWYVAQGFDGSGRRRTLRGQTRWARPGCGGIDATG
jgi:NO-binding membrane sensor protein with MHYT domain